MNKKLILRHKINENPYGLYNSQLKPMSREETIEFFNEIDLTDEELLSLNDYILEDAGHSFFDNAYMVWNEPMKLISKTSHGWQLSTEFSCIMIIQMLFLREEEVP